MTALTTEQSERTAAYKAELAQAADLLKLLAHHVANFGYEDLDTINWGHIGAAARLVQWLRNPVAEVLNIDDTDPTFPQAVAKYQTQHGLAGRQRR